MKMKDKKNIPIMTMLIILFCWGSFAAVSKMTLKNIDSFQMLFYMFGSAFLILTITFAFNGKLEQIKALTKKELLKLILISMTSFMYYFLYSLALKLVPAIEASMLNYLFPVMIVVFAIPINKEKLDTLKIVSIFFGFTGMLIILTKGNIINLRLTNVTGDILAVFAAAMWGVFSNLGKRNSIDNWISNYVYVLAAFCSSIISMFVFSRFIVPDIKTLVGTFWIGMSNIVIAYYLWFKVLKTTSTVLVSSFSFITPFVTLVFIMLLLGERITWIQVAGLSVIVIGIVVQSLRKSDFKSL
jgi:drug/metabolite transporter (DMT)-like permease